MPHPVTDVVEPLQPPVAVLCDEEGAVILLRKGSRRIFVPRVYCDSQRCHVGAQSLYRLQDSFCIAQEGRKVVTYRMIRYRLKDSLCILQARS